MKSLFQQIQKFLQAPYSYFPSKRGSVKASLWAGLFVGGFLLIFQPFGLREAQFPYKIPILAGFGVVTTLINLVVNLLLKPILGLNRQIRIWHWILGECFLILLIASGNYVYLMFWSDGKWLGVPSYGMMLLFTLLIGIFPITYIAITQRLRVLKNQVDPHGSNPKNKVPILPLTIYSDQTKDHFETSTQSLIFLEASDNYVSLHYLEKEIIQKKLMRITLSDVMKQLPQEYFMRCHRSYIVNLLMVEEAKGNAQGMLLFLKHTEERIPVSRRNIPKLRKRLG